MKFLTQNRIEGEMPDEVFQQKIEAEAKTRDMKRYGRDGSFMVYEEKFEHNGVPYWIRINRYFQIGVPLNEVKGMNAISKWAVLEYDDSYKEIAHLIGTIENETGIYEWMWKDALHCHQDKWTLQEQVAWLHEEAQNDIDALPQLESALEAHYKEQSEKVKRLQLILSQLTSERREE